MICSQLTKDGKPPRTQSVLLEGPERTHGFPTHQSHCRIGFRLINFFCQVPNQVLTFDIKRNASIGCALISSVHMPNR